MRTIHRDRDRASVGQQATNFIVHKEEEQPFRLNVDVDLLVGQVLQPHAHTST
jgi:hypothetical protein